MALILIVDDSPLIRALLSKQLEEQGYRLAEANDGEEGLQAARQHMPDVILVDVEMPTMDGFQLLRALKNDVDLADIPVVFLTARADTDDIVRGLEAGAHDYLRKPFEPSELTARVSAAVRVKDLQDELKRRAEELDRTARVDVLTGLYNRRHLERELTRILDGAHRRSETVAAIMIDIDNFKDINDTMGHLGGDSALRTVATRIQVGLHNDEVAGRWGGDEFLVLCAGCTDDELQKRAEAIRSTIGDHEVGCEIPDDGGGKPGRRMMTVTVSVGAAATLSGSGDAVIRRADSAMYEAKRRGRNQVVVVTTDGALAEDPHR